MWSLERQIAEATAKLATIEKENHDLRAGRKVSESRRSSHHTVNLVEGFIGTGLSREAAELAAGRKISENKSEEKESSLVESFMGCGLSKEEARLAAGQRCRTPIFV
jgi:hypothetical protein